MILLHVADAPLQWKQQTTYWSANKLIASLESLRKANTCIYILQQFEHGLTQALSIPHLTKSPPPPPLKLIANQYAPALADAVHHQNLIGWDVLLRGYLSTFWEKYQNTQSTGIKNK
jgi:hypothetical protein